MSRTRTATDRLAVLLVGLALLAAGVGVLAWGAGLIADRHGAITMAGLVTATASGWWPWATSTAGVVCIVGGLRWLISHRPAPRIPALTLTGSSRAGRLTANLGSLADAAATNLASRPAVRSANGKAVLDRGSPSIHLDATAASADSLAEAAQNADDISATVAAMLATPISVRTRLHVGTKRPAKQ
jgi:hypothetical protein